MLTVLNVLRLRGRCCLVRLMNVCLTFALFLFALLGAQFQSLIRMLITSLKFIFMFYLKYIFSTNFLGILRSVYCSIGSCFGLQKNHISKHSNISEYSLSSTNQIRPSVLSWYLPP